jgi:AcrR family transcriptional regulator
VVQAPGRAARAEHVPASPAPGSEPLSSGAPGSPALSSGGPGSRALSSGAPGSRVLSRRDRVRAATTQEIKQTARRILIEQGPDAVSLRAIAREMGMTAPALYRYFDSREELIKAVCCDIFDELTADLKAAIDAAGAATGGDLTTRVMAAAREFRRWALNHSREFGMLFGTPLPGVNIEQDETITESGGKFGNTFFVLILELWRKHPFPVPADDEIDPGLRDQLDRYREHLGGLAADLPRGLLLTFLRCWVRLYGIVALEVFGHLGFALDDAEPMFEMMLADTAPLLGLRLPPPAGQ